MPSTGSAFLIFFNWKLVRCNCIGETLPFFFLKMYMDASARDVIINIAKLKRINDIMLDYGIIG